MNDKEADQICLVGIHGLCPRLSTFLWKLEKFNSTAIAAKGGGQKDKMLSNDNVMTIGESVKISVPQTAHRPVGLRLVAASTTAAGTASDPHSLAPHP
ncbi:hypothetical protein EVAR_59258_1 [Eumeta japonica]|uniref:Uncharacterized protein n=1 Tax=Eumeta variegata TaxID=151549 RepID=A0A4C1YN51_EUMVA|nr:hypothetical protein EVAR_59258_1 [Eumeta japonica]